MSEAVLEAPWLCIDAHCGARLPRGKGGGGGPRGLGLLCSYSSRSGVGELERAARSFA